MGDARGGKKPKNLHHQDEIHDVDFDFWGTRMATCSSDHTVRVWEWDAACGKWNHFTSWKAHKGPVCKVTWAHPEFGQVLATCSFDKSVAVWQEIREQKRTSDGASATPWKERAVLTDATGYVTDVKFAPRHMGLVLASCSRDGIIRIYEASDVANLTQWSLQHEIPVKFSCSCISWNPTFPRLYPPLIAVGVDDVRPEIPKVIIYELDDYVSSWIQVESLEQVTTPVNDLAFAQNLGRPYHMLAIASDDLHIVSLEPQTCPYSSSEDEDPCPTVIVSKTDAKIDHHYSTVWRVAWNDTGNILASTGDDGRVRLWKCNFKGDWKCLVAVAGDRRLPIINPSEPGFRTLSNRLRDPEPPNISLLNIGLPRPSTSTYVYEN